MLLRRSEINNTKQVLFIDGENDEYMSSKRLAMVVRGSSRSSDGFSRYPFKNARHPPRASAALGDGVTAASYVGRLWSILRSLTARLIYRRGGDDVSIADPKDELFRPSETLEIHTSMWVRDSSHAHARPESLVRSRVVIEWLQLKIGLSWLKLCFRKKCGQDNRRAIASSSYTILKPARLDSAGNTTGMKVV